MPVYNAEAFLWDSINSIVSQDFLDYECILIDDGSNDNSFFIMSKFAEEYSQIRVFTQTNHGPAYTRNLGIQKAQGEYILFIDSDDCYVPGMLKKIYKQLSIDYPDVMCFGYEEIDKIEGKQGIGKQYSVQKRVVYRTRKQIEQNMIELLEKRVLISSTCNKAYSRKILIKNNVKLPENMYLAEDLYFNLSVLECVQSFYFIPEVYYQYIHRNDSSIILRYKSDKYKQLMLCHEKRKQLLIKYGIHNNQIEALVQMDYIRICFSCFMDLFLKDCPLSKKEKIKFIDRIIQDNKEVFKFKKLRYLCWKEKIVYIIFGMKNKYVLYESSWICYILKFHLGLSF